MVMVTDRWYRDIRGKKRKRKKSRACSVLAWLTEGKESNNTNKIVNDREKKKRI
jgi:hypothetical protein